MQTNAPEGGRGYLTSLRGGGPLTTIVLGDERHSSLWHTVWLNTLGSDDFLGMCGNNTKNIDSDKFPWLTKTRTGVKTAPIEVHPAQMYWGMPRRIKLNLENGVQGQCDICGIYSNDLIVSYREKIQGNNYKGAWLHPLSPYFYKDKVPSATHAQPGGVSYRHWLGFIQEDGKEKLPAYVVHEFREHRLQPDWQFRLWAFGYDMESNKPCCWYESVMPLITVNIESVKNYENEIANLISTAAIICANTKIAIKRAIQGRPQFDPLTKTIKWKYHDIKKIPSDEQDERKKVLYSIKDQSVFMVNDVFFWQSTEKAFYAALYSLKKAFEVGYGSVEEIHMAWHATLCKTASNLFDLNVSGEQIEDADPKRVVLASNEMEKFNRGNKIKELLGLPIVQKSKGKKKKV